MAVRVTSDAHQGLVSAIGATLPGASWQRCQTHYAATLMTITPKTSWPWVRTLLLSTYDQPDADSVVAQYDRVLESLTKKLPRVVAHLQENRAHGLGFTAVPKEIWRQIWSNNAPGATQSRGPPQDQCGRHLPGPGLTDPPHPRRRPD